MGFFGDLLKNVASSVESAAENTREYYDEAYSYYSSAGKARLMSDLEEINRSTASLKNMAKKSAIKDICIEKGYMSGSYSSYHR